MSNKKSTVEFEKILKELEDLVKKMESGNLSLEESLVNFEHGMELTKQCQNAIKEAEQRVQILLNEGKTEPQHLENYKTQ